MEGSFYRSNINHFEEDDLEASVWDDVRENNSSSNDNHKVDMNNDNNLIGEKIDEDNAINELSQTFANISVLGTGIGSSLNESIPYENAPQTDTLIDQSNISSYL